MDYLSKNSIPGTGPLAPDISASSQMQAKRLPQVHEQTQRLEQTLQVLGERWAKLRERLEPIIHRIPTPECPQKPDGRPSMCGVAGVLYETSSQLDHLADDISDVLNQIQI